MLTLSSHASTAAFAGAIARYSFPSQNLCFCRISYSHDAIAHSTLNASQEHSPWLPFHPFPLPGACQTEHCMQLSLLWAGNKGQKSGAVNLPPVAIPGFSSGYRNMLWWQVNLLALLRWKEMLKYRISVSCSPFLYMMQERNSNSPAWTLEVLKLLWSHILLVSCQGALLTFSHFHNLCKP